MSDRTKESLVDNLRRMSAWVHHDLLNEAADEITALTARLAAAEAKLKRYHTPLVRDTFCIDMDNPIAEGLVLECIEPKVLAATVRRENQMRLSWLAKCIVLEADNATLRGLLREALGEARAPDDDPERWYGDEIPDEWFDRAQAALEGKP